MENRLKVSALAALAAFLLSASSAPGGAQTPSPPPGSAASILPHVAVTAEALAGLPRRTVSVRTEDGTATYTGVDLGALLAQKGAPHGLSLHGKNAADYALVTATDGYRTVFALAELDASLSDKIVLLADSRDGKPLDAKVGPFQIIVPDERHHLRWIRNVSEIDVLAAP